MQREGKRLSAWVRSGEQRRKNTRHGGQLIGRRSQNRPGESASKVAVCNCHMRTVLGLLKWHYYGPAAVLLLGLRWACAPSCNDLLDSAMPMT